MKEVDTVISNADNSGASKQASKQASKATFVIRLSIDPR